MFCCIVARLTCYFFRESLLAFFSVRKKKLLQICVYLTQKFQICVYGSIARKHRKICAIPCTTATTYIQRLISQIFKCNVSQPVEYEIESIVVSSF